jgi:hypothetical protein
MKEVSAALGHETGRKMARTEQQWWRQILVSTGTHRALAEWAC